jgi:hypothetical protein
MSMSFENLELNLGAYAETLRGVKRDCGDPGFAWYPYDTLANIIHLSRTLTPEGKQLFSRPLGIADIGCADGDLAFFLEANGHRCDVYDYGPTNMNGLRAARLVKERLHSGVGIFEVDLDAQFQLHGSYDLILFLGILYHLKNPFYALEALAKASRYCAVSTRTTRFFRAGGPDVSSYPAAYLLDTHEANNDPTNFWIFTEAGLHRCAERAGWRVVNSVSLGDLQLSNPQDNDHDQRTFLFLESRR